MLLCSDHLGAKSLMVCEANLGYGSLCCESVNNLTLDRSSKRKGRTKRLRLFYSAKQRQGACMTPFSSPKTHRKTYLTLTPNQQHNIYSLTIQLNNSPQIPIPPLPTLVYSPPSTSNDLLLNVICILRSLVNIDSSPHSSFLLVARLSFKGGIYWALARIRMMNSF